MVRMHLLIFLMFSYRIVSPHTKNQVSMAALHRACTMTIPEMTVEDAECMAVSLIDQGYIRGYILHGRQIL